MCVMGSGVGVNGRCVASKDQCLRNRKKGVGVGEHMPGGGEIFFRKTESANRFLMKK
jgi:hypothetical protein